MKNYRLTVDLQMDSTETVIIFAKVLSKSMQVTAETTIDICSHDEAHIVLGYTNIESVSEFRPNK